jgi:hypothetical protein
MNYQPSLTKISHPAAIEWKSLFRDIRSRYAEQTGGKKARITSCRKNGNLAYKVGGCVAVLLEDNNTVFVDCSLIRSEIKNQIGA